jgi:hypothetical protein
MQSVIAPVEHEDLIDAVITTPEVFRETSRAALKPQPSQKPGPAMMDACIAGNEESIAIRNAWKFNHPITVVSRAEFEAMVERQGSVVFVG